MPLRPAYPRLAAVTAALLGAVLALVPGPNGCAHSARKVDVLPPEPVVQAMSSRPTADVSRTITDSLSSALVKPTAPVVPPKNALLVSGGGQYAAYSSGLLVGWSATGTRPTFDICTGVSSGAIVAAYAFLGDKYDCRLQDFFTNKGDRDLFTYRPFRLFRNGAIASPDKLNAIVCAEINDAFLADLRAAHQAGRRLYVGTMNVRTRRVCVWDVGGIACCGRPDADTLVRRVMLASGSIPGLLPAVRFEVEVDGCKYVEEHVDGGAACQTFLRLPPGAERPFPGATGWLAGSNLYALSAGKLYPPILEGKMGFLRRVTTTVSAALYALYRAELVGLYAFCGVSGMKFHLNALPQDAPAPPNSTTFDPAEMRKLFGMGYEYGVKGIPWRLTPPGAEPGEEEQPRDVPPFVPGGAK